MVLARGPPSNGYHRVWMSLFWICCKVVASQATSEHECLSCLFLGSHIMGATELGLFFGAKLILNSRGDGSDLNSK